MGHVPSGIEQGCGGLEEKLRWPNPASSRLPTHETKPRREEMDSGVERRNETIEGAGCQLLRSYNRKCLFLRQPSNEMNLVQTPRPWPTVVREKVHSPSYALDEA
jgi:hypothetical protein